MSLTGLPGLPPKEVRVCALPLLSMRATVVLGVPVSWPLSARCSPEMPMSPVVLPSGWFSVSTSAVGAPTLPSSAGAKVLSTASVRCAVWNTAPGRS